MAGCDASRLQGEDGEAENTGETGARQDGTLDGTGRGNGGLAGGGVAGRLDGRDGGVVAAASACQILLPRDPFPSFRAICYE